MATDYIQGNSIDAVEQFFAPQYQSYFNAESVVMAQGNFMATNSTSNNVICGVSINEHGNVRDDKANFVRITLGDEALAQFSPVYMKTFLGDDQLGDNISSCLQVYEPGTLCIFFALKPNFGEFKKGLRGDELVSVQNINTTSKCIEIKVNFKKSLRPTHCLEEEYQKKKKNWMNLHVVLVYKKSPDAPFSSVMAIEPFRFRSNSGKSNRIYLKKRKVSDTDWDELSDEAVPKSTFVSHIPNQAITHAPNTKRHKESSHWQSEPLGDDYFNPHVTIDTAFLDSSLANFNNYNAHRTTTDVISACAAAAGPSIKTEKHAVSPHYGNAQTLRGSNTSYNQMITDEIQTMCASPTNLNHNYHTNVPVSMNTSYGHSSGSNRNHLTPVDFPMYLNNHAVQAPAAPISAKPLIQRIYPNRCYAFQVWDCDNPEVTTLLLGDNLESASIRVGFVHPQREFVCPALPSRVPFGEKEYMVPCLKRLLGDEIIALPEAGLTVDVVFNGELGEILNGSQYYTYLNFRPMAQLAFYGNQVPTHDPPHYSLGQTSGSSLVGQPEGYSFPSQIDEEEMMQYFTSHSINVQKCDNKGRSMLHASVLLGSKRLVQLALDSNSNVNLQDSFGCTPLHYAVFNGREDIAGMLLKAGAVNDLQDCNKDTPLSLAVELAEFNVVNVILKSIPAEVEILRGDLTPERLKTALAWLGSMAGKTLQWRRGALPFMNEPALMVCAAATLEKASFVRYHSALDMFSMKIAFLETVGKALFPPKKRLFTRIQTTMAPSEPDETITASPLRRTGRDIRRTSATRQEEDENLRALKASLESPGWKPFNIPEVPVIAAAAPSPRNSASMTPKPPRASGESHKKSEQEKKENDDDEDEFFSMDSDGDDDK